MFLPKYVFAHNTQYCMYTLVYAQYVHQASCLHVYTLASTVYLLCVRTCVNMQMCVCACVCILMCKICLCACEWQSESYRHWESPVIEVCWVSHIIISVLECICYTGVVGVMVNSAFAPGDGVINLGPRSEPSTQAESVFTSSVPSMWICSGLKDVIRNRVFPSFNILLKVWRIIIPRGTLSSLLLFPHSVAALNLSDLLSTSSSYARRLSQFSLYFSPLKSADWIDTREAFEWEKTTHQSYLCWLRVIWSISDSHPGQTWL